MKNYLSLMRVKHYIKNLLIFLAILCSGRFFHREDLILTIVEFISFSLIASSVYILNDIKDVEKDRKHPRKKERPIAKGTISIKKAQIFFFILIIMSMFIQLTLLKTNLLSYERCILSTGFLLLYLLLNIFYSSYAKNIPVVDIMILSFGFLIRVYYGGAIIGAPISDWLYLTILSFSLYLVIGKRRGELIKQKSGKREVLKYYTKDFLDKAMYTFQTLTLVFYSLWCSIGYKNQNSMLIYSVLIIIFITLRYSLIVERDSFADPVDIVLEDKILQVSILVYAIYMGVILYV